MYIVVPTKSLEAWRITKGLAAAWITFTAGRESSAGLAIGLRIADEPPQPLDRTVGVGEQLGLMEAEMPVSLFDLAPGERRELVDAIHGSPEMSGDCLVRRLAAVLAQLPELPTILRGTRQASQQGEGLLVGQARLFRYGSSEFVLGEA
jgi:hypothetical protein